MVAAALRNAGLGLDVDGRVADAEQIPTTPATFDVVVGHACYRIPDLDTAFREVLRVLKPRGQFVFAGEPTRIATAAPRRPHLEGHHAVTPPARAGGCSACRPAGRVVARRRAGGGRRHPHVRPGRPRGPRPRRGAADVPRSPRSSPPDAGLAGADVQPPSAGQARHGRACSPARLAAAVLAGRARPRARRAGWFYNAVVTGTRPPSSP